MVVDVSKITAEVAGRKATAQTVAPNYIPEALDVLLHNWRDVGFSISADWTTDVTTAYSGAEDRQSLVDRPARTFSVRFTGLRRGVAARLHSLLARQAHQRLLLPIYCDRTRLGSAAAAGATSITVETTAYRRFFVGGRIVLHGFGARSDPENAEVATIATVSGSTLGLAAPLALDHAAGERVMPMAETEVRLDGSAVILSDLATDLRLDMNEVGGPSAIPPWIPFGDFPDLPTYRQIPILTIRPDWSGPRSVKVVRPGQTQSVGRVLEVETFSDRPIFGHTLSYTGLDRERAWAIMRFVDYCRGRAEVFWQPDPSIIWTATQLNPGSVFISTDASFDDLRRFYRYVSLRFLDGSVLVREIESASTSIGLVTLTFAEDIPSTVADVDLLKSVTPAYLKRLESDAYTEQWLTDDKLTIDLSTIEVPREQRSRIITFDESITPTSPGSIADCFLDLSATSDLYQPGGSPVSATEDLVGTWTDQRTGVPTSLQTPSSGYQDHTYITTPGVVMARYNPSPPNRGVLELAGGGVLHSNALGMTIFIRIRQRATDNTYLDMANDYLVRYPNALDDGTDSFEWTWTGVKMNDDAGVDREEGWITTPDLASPAGTTHVLCLTWKPGQHARVYRGGVLLGESPQPIVDLPAALDYSPRLFYLANPGNDPGNTTDDTQVFSCAVFKRGLTKEELNSVGRHFDGNWRRIV